MQLQQTADIGEGQLRRAVEWLISKTLLEIIGETTTAAVLLTEVGRDYAEKNATPESAMLSRAATESVTLKDL